MRDSLVLFLFVASVPFCFLRPTYGIVVWTVMSFVNPQSFTWGLARNLNLSFFVAVATLLGFFCFAPRFKRLAHFEVLLIVGLWAWFTLTMLNSVSDPVFAEKIADGWYKWGLTSKIILMTVVSIAVIDTWDRLRWVVLSIAGSFGFLVLKSLPMIVLSGGGLRVYGPENSMIADNNDFALALNMALPFFFFLAKTESVRWIKWLMSFLFVITIPVILFTYSRGGLLGLIAVLLCMILQAKQKRILIPFAALVILFAAFLTPEAWRNRMDTGNAMNASALSRLNAWTYSWNLALDYPLTGGGFECFTPSLFTRYAPNTKDWHGPHSIYFGVLAEHGFPGLFFYLLLVTTCFACLRRSRKLGRWSGNDYITSYTNMLRFSLIGFLVSGAFLGRAYFDLYFSVVACAIILKQLVQADWAEKSQPIKAQEQLEVAGAVDLVHGGAQ